MAEDDEKTAAVGVSMPARLIADLAREAKAEGKDFSSYLVELVVIGRRNRHGRS